MPEFDSKGSQASRCGNAGTQFIKWRSIIRKLWIWIKGDLSLDKFYL
jgi:hypothetical protein